MNKGKTHLCTLDCMDLPLALIWGISNETLFHNLLEYLGSDELLSSEFDIESFEIDYSIINNRDPLSVAESTQIFPLYNFSKVLTNSYHAIFLDYSLVNGRIHKKKSTPIPDWQSEFLAEYIDFDPSSIKSIEEMATIGVTMTRDILDKLDKAYSEVGINQYSGTHYISCELFKSGVSYYCVEDLLHFILNSSDMYSPKVIILRRDGNIKDEQHLTGHPLFNERKLPEYIYNIENGNEQFDYFDFKLLDGTIVKIHSRQVLRPLELDDYNEIYF